MQKFLRHGVQKVCPQWIMILGMRVNRSYLLRHNWHFYLLSNLLEKLRISGVSSSMMVSACLKKQVVGFWSFFITDDLESNERIIKFENTLNFKSLKLIDRFYQQFKKMSYSPIPESEDNKKIQELLQHRNPIFKDLKYPKPQPIHTLESQITSSLFFQQLIYFNSIYSALFAILYLISQTQRFIFFEIEYGVPIRIIIFIVFAALQICRLQNGFHGNLKESFPEICAFLMLTIFTIAAQLALLVEFVKASPLQWSLLFYGSIFHILEFLVCICTMGRLTQTQKALFLWRNPQSVSSSSKK